MTRALIFGAVIFGGGVSKLKIGARLLVNGVIVEVVEHVGTSQVAVQEVTDTLTPRLSSDRLKVTPRQYGAQPHRRWGTRK